MIGIKSRYYKVADLIFKVLVPSEVNLDELLPSYRDFVCDEDSLDQSDTLLFALDTAGNTTKERLLSATLIDRFCNDVGHVRLYKNEATYLVALKYQKDATPSYMTFDHTFSQFKVTVDWTDRYISNILDSMLRIAFSQSCLLHDAVSIHASVVIFNHYGYLFLGKSGTGKSTHSRLWLSSFEGTELLNDDNPIIRLIQGESFVYGSPWSGKTRCYKNKSYPIGGIVRLSQAPNNRFTILKNVEAFSSIMPSCSVLRDNRDLEERLFSILIQMGKRLRVGRLECLPNKEAATLCCHNMAESI
jgi:hypothetical protein